MIPRPVVWRRSTIIWTWLPVVYAAHAAGSYRWWFRMRQVASFFSGTVQYLVGNRSRCRDRLIWKYEQKLKISKFLKRMKTYIFMIYSWFTEIDSNWLVNISDIHDFVCMDLYWSVLTSSVKNIKKTHNNVWQSLSLSAAND